jgi:hypothetical protein
MVLQESEILHLFLLFLFFFIAHFLLVENTYKNPYSLKAVNSTDIYISSNKFVMNGAISMEVRFNTFPLSR